MDFFLLLIVAIPPILWFVSIKVLSKWSYFKLFFAANTLLVLGYTLYLIYGDVFFIGIDPYGLQRLFYLFLVPTIHIVLNFLFSQIMRARLKKSWDQPQIPGA